MIVIPDIQAMADQQLQPDGIHLTAKGHAAVAARLLPKVAEYLDALRTRAGDVN
jgi:lysophospholipase L1-like esterase